MELKSVSQLVREAEQNDQDGSTQFSKYVSGNMREDIAITEAYLNSKHISGDTDYMGRSKPFFNIVTAIRNVWYRATDVDIKDIVITDKNPVKALLATILFQDWMKKAKFSKFLNAWGLSLASHGSAVSEFLEQDGELKASVLDWNNLVVDPIDFENNLKIKILWLTPSQLRKNKSYDKKLVKRLLESRTTRKTNEGQTKDQKSDYIKVYEVHGELSQAQYNQAKGEDYDEKDEDEFFDQMHVITFQDKREADTDEEGYTLYVGREAKSPHYLSHLIEKDGQTYTGGAVKNAFDAQWMVNDAEKNIKDHLELASKQIYQTSDGSFVGQNALVNIEQGDVLVHKINEPITRIQNTADINALQSFKADWQGVASQINGVSEAMMGAAPKSGTAWRQTQALLQENHSLFELMAENKGIALIEMLREYVIPFFKKQLNNSKEISSILEEHQIKQIDAMYLPNEVMRRVNNKKKDTILSGAIYDTGTEAADMMSAEAEIKGNLTGNQRLIKPSEISSGTWKEFFKDMEWELDIDVTGETKDVQGALATLSTVLQTIAGNPMVLQDPNFKMIFNKIISMTGTISPLELSTVQSQPAPVMAQPMMQPV